MNNRNTPASPISEETTDRVDEGIYIYVGLTKLERLAMDIYLIGIKTSSGPVSDDELVDGAFRRAHAFFDYQENNGPT